ncbi:DNA starvation/stationary phase protection protein [Vibrio zhanjiangensis]|uniref:DNA starvation/stationary phase protection protein n=1 Tax=Vibrio zhanjiangensis TaxID=1046128 RepID=A0ABQ6F075_9VIBR|nr:Dps family protein [Vibrio zhanjiangensis]GLT18614.1 DNA starvation/stationary phase protection protein [Vibrio zhanjiangensis]
MTNQVNLIGLNNEKSQALASELNALLAHYQVLYMNTRGYHWNIKGQQFFELHEKFEEIYVDLQAKIDELAERILTLGSTPDHSFSQYLDKSKIQEHQNATTGKECVRGLVHGFTALLIQQRQILAQAEEADDEKWPPIFGHDFK